MSRASSDDPHETGEGRVRRLYRFLLGFYPARLRQRYKKDLLEAFDDRRAEPRFRGPVGTVRLALFLARDLIFSLRLVRSERRGSGNLENPMNDFARDLVYSVRMLVKNPVFTLAVIVTLALGIGLNVATFSTVHSLLLRPLPGAEDPQELVQLYRAWPGLEYGSNSVPHYQDVRDRSDEVFDEVAAWYFATMSMSADGRSERLMGMLVSANLFQTFGADMALGRPFLADEESVGPGAHPVAILGHGFWQRRFGGDPDIVGRTVILNGHPFEVVGVAAREFKSPVSFADVPVYVPLMMQPTIEPGVDRLEVRGTNTMNVVARLKDGQTLERAAEHMDRLLMQLKEEHSNYDEQVGTTLVLQNEAGIHPMFRSAQVGMSAVMMTVVGLLLLIACLNVANLFLARARERHREMGIRVSLGAGRRRIVQQLFTESLVFGVLGGAAGLGLAALATRALAVFQPPVDGPWAFDVRLDGTVLAFAMAISLGSALLFGLAPALRAVRTDTLAAVKGEGGGSGGRSRASSVLVIVQMALSLVLLVSSGLFLRSLQGATRIDPGFDDPESLVMASMDPSLQGYDEVRSRAFYDRLLDELRALPEVAAAGLATNVPLGFVSSDRGVTIPGYEFAEGERRSIPYVMITEGYLEAMGIEVVEGRAFTTQDDAAGPPVIIVNRHFAERFWPGESALGRVVETAGAEREVVGVVETGKYQSLGEAPVDYMYLPHRERFIAGMTVVARTPADPQAALGRIREVVRAAEPDLPLYDVRTMADHMGVALLPARLGGSVLGVFGLLGLTLAAVGIYGVMAYSVARRTRELGIRVALGADRRRVVKMVVGEGLRMTLLGAAIGLVGAALATRLVAGMLYDVSALDPVAFVGVPLLLVGVAALAVYVPARRAAGADPMRALKTD